MKLGRIIPAAILAAWNLVAANVPPPAVDLPPPGTGKVATLVLAGGHFWTLEAVFERLKGVVAVVSGYAGGKAEDANYDRVSSGKTAHVEAVQITYDPSQISYGKLLQVFFAVAHDPTQVDRQGTDYGRNYRSVIFYTTDAQKRVAQEYIAQINRAKVFHDPLATQVSLLPGFFPAEDYHQHYARQHPHDRYVVENVTPKVRALEQQFPDLLKQQ